MNEDKFFSKVRSWSKMFFVGLISFSIDQFSKFFARFLGFDLVLNQGISWGILRNYLQFNNIFLSSLLLVLIVLFFLTLKKEWQKYQVVSGLIFGGAISNLIDRFFYDGVVDWLKVPFFDLKNNLADWFIFIGMGFYMYLIVKRKDEEKK